MIELIFFVEKHFERWILRLISYYTNKNASKIDRNCTNACNISLNSKISQRMGKFVIATASIAIATSIFPKVDIAEEFVYASFKFL